MTTATTPSYMSLVSKKDLTTLLHLKDEHKAIFPSYLRAKKKLQKVADQIEAIQEKYRALEFRKKCREAAQKRNAERAAHLAKHPPAKNASVARQFKLRWHRNIGGVLNDGTFGGYVFDLPVKADKDVSIDVRLEILRYRTDYTAPQNEANFCKHGADGAIFVGYTSDPAAKALAGKIAAAFHKAYPKAKIKIVKGGLD